MERSKLVFWIVVSLASASIVWWVGFHTPVDGPAHAAPDPNALAEPNAVAEPNEPVDVNQAEGPADANRPGGLADANEPRRPTAFDERRGPGRRSGGFGGPDERSRGPRPGRITDANEPNRPSDSNEPMELVNLKGVEMKMIIEKLAAWTGKVIIPDDEAMKQKITIYAPARLPRSKALQTVYSALRMKGIVATTEDDTIFLEPIEGIKLGRVPTIAADVLLATIENKDQVVQKFFELDSYSPTEMAAVIQPLIGEHGHVNADENAGSLLVIDTVSNLMRLERIIDQFDVPEAEQMVTRVFEVQYGDPSEICQMLNILLGETGSRSSRSTRGSERDRGSSGGGFRGGFFGPRPTPQPASPPVKKTPSSSSKGAASSVIVGTTRGPVILIPEPRRNWIIARASAEDMERIGEWIDKLDKEEPVESEYEIVPLKYADPGEVEDSVEDGFRDLPGMEFMPSILIEPLRTTKQVIIFGRKDLREIVKKMIAEIDIPPDMFETQHFPLKYADPDQIKTMIEELFGQPSTSSGSRYTYISYYGSSRGGSSTSADTVKVISYATLKQVTVIASPEKMEEIAKQIEEWDKPLDIDQVRPRIITLKNSDPIEMAELLNTLFSEKTTSRMSIFDIIYGSAQDKQKIVGPLYGQLTFEDVPGTKKIIVISKIPEAYDVIEQLVLELDREEMAEVPKVITLKYADPEDLSERLNAMFVQPGQQARIRLSESGLRDYSMEETDGQSSSSSQTQSDQGTYTPPWSGSGARSGIDQEMPVSNVIGRIRFVPEPHTKSIMVLAPPEFMDEIGGLIEELDVPGKQVLIKAIIIEVEHTSMTSLGIQLRSGAFASLGENSVQFLNTFRILEQHGSAVFGAGGESGSTYSVDSRSTDVAILIDFLMKNTNARVLNEQSLWTKDNKEAEFFKGQKVAFQTDSSVSDTGGRTTFSFEFEKVGMTLRVRPSITPEKHVDMVVNVVLSQLTADFINDQPVRTEMDTTTNMIVKHGETLLLGGILFQKDSLIQRKIPLLGDLPGVGGLFRHNDKVESNNELLVFITPHVIEDANDVLPKETLEKIEKLKDIKEQLGTVMEALDQ